MYLAVNYKKNLADMAACEHIQNMKHMWGLGKCHKKHRGTKNHHLVCHVAQFIWQCHLNKDSYDTIL
jgi:hypothetical protein